MNNNETDAIMRYFEGKPTFPIMNNMAEKVRLHAIAMNRACKKLSSKMHLDNQKAVYFEEGDPSLAFKYELTALLKEQALKRYETIAKSDLEQSKQMTIKQRRGLPNRHDFQRYERLHPKKKS